MDRYKSLLPNMQKNIYIRNVRNIFNSANAVTQKCGRNNRNSGVFRPADLHFAVEAVTAFDDVFFQNGSPLTLFYLGCVKGTIKSFGNIDDSMSQPLSING